MYMLLGACSLNCGWSFMAELIRILTFSGESPQLSYMGIYGQRVQVLGSVIIDENLSVPFPHFVFTFLRKGALAIASLAAANTHVHQAGETIFVARGLVCTNLPYMIPNLLKHRTGSSKKPYKSTL
ncbi:hypothetical protein DVH24_041829 [Malus domestica]|uniref:Uncharacterized protein n=1 Tax=Malus domestica TaxID=3750 RepID=A0A498IUH7_MALDO|nr:hypothetical protein DVH24_041829 [Malus domestica]